MRGRPAYERIRAGVEMLKRHGISFTVISVVSNDTVTNAAETLGFLDALGSPLVGFNIEEKEGVNTRDATPSMEQARRFWRDVLMWTTTHPHMEVREVRHLLHYLAMDQAARVTDELHDTIPTVAHNGDVVVLSPELLGARDKRYGDFIAGNVLNEPLVDILHRAPDLPYVREFVASIERCKATCDFFAYCQGSHAGNRYFEHGTFTATETQHCRTSTQALVLALHDIACPEGDRRMTVLEQLARVTFRDQAKMVKSHRVSCEPDAVDTPRLGPKFDNRPTWDNWKKKDSPWSKKRIYFRDR